MRKRASGRCRRTSSSGWRCFELSWTEENAKRGTVGQLRLALKENREAARASEEALDEWKSPVGLSRMALASLQAEALRRGIPTESPSRPSKMKVREG